MLLLFGTHYVTNIINPSIVSYIPDIDYIHTEKKGLDNPKMLQKEIIIYKTPLVRVPAVVQSAWAVIALGFDCA